MASNAMGKSYGLPAKFLEAIGEYQDALRNTKRELKDLEREANRVTRKGGEVDKATRGRLDQLRGQADRLQDRVDQQKENMQESISARQRAALLSRVQLSGFKPQKNPFSLSSLYETATGLGGILAEKANILPAGSIGQRFAAAGASAIGKGVGAFNAVSPHLATAAGIGMGVGIGVYALKKAADLYIGHTDVIKAEARRIEDTARSNMAYIRQIGYHGSAIKALPMYQTQKRQMIENYQNVVASGSPIRAALSSLGLFPSFEAEQVNRASQLESALNKRELEAQRLGSVAQRKYSYSEVRNRSKGRIAVEAEGRYYESSSAAAYHYLADSIKFNLRLFSLGLINPKSETEVLEEEIAMELYNESLTKIHSTRADAVKEYQGASRFARHRALAHERSDSLAAFNSDRFSRGVLYQEI